MANSFPVGQAPWETPQNAATPTSFAVGQAPWESPTSPLAQSSNPVQSPQPSYNPVADVLGSDTKKAGGFFSSLIQNSIGSRGIAGVAQLPAKVYSAVSEYGPTGQNQAVLLNQQAQDTYNHATDLLIKARTEADPTKQDTYRSIAKDLIKNADNLTKSADKISQVTDTTPGQALGTAANAGITIATGAEPNLLGEVNPAFKTLAEGTSFINNGAKTLYYSGRAVENAALGLGLNTASNLNEGKPLTEGAIPAALGGAALPILGSGLSEVVNKARGGAESSAEGVINSLIKPLGKDFAYGKNPAQGVIGEGITANSLDELAQKVIARKNEVGKEIGAIGDQITQKETTALTGNQIGQTGRKVSINPLDLTPALNPIDEAMGQAAKNNNPTLLASLHNVKVALTHDLGLGMSEAGTPMIIKGAEKDLSGITYNEGVKFMSDISDHTRFTGNPSDDKALNAATKKAYNTARELMNSHATEVDPALGSQIKSLNERYANLSSAKSAIIHRDIVEKRQNIFSLATKIGAGSIAASTIAASMVSGNYKKAAEIALTELGGYLVGQKILGSVSGKTRLAQFLMRLAPEDRQGLLRVPVIKNYWDRLTGIPKTPAETINTGNRS